MSTKTWLAVATLAVSTAGWSAADPLKPPLGLPVVPIPADNPQTEAKVKLGDKLYNDVRFSSTGAVSCATCHDPAKAFTDSPLPVSEGINKLKGTRNAPTVLNSAYFDSMFWDGREPTLEKQSLQPMVNPVEMALPNHEPVLKIVRSDPEYVAQFQAVFGKTGEQVSMVEVSQAIAAFERTQISGNSPFDRWHFGGDGKAVSESAKRGFTVFLEQGRCVSCHAVSQSHALFTDSRFHNINVGFPKIDQDVAGMATAFSAAKRQGTNVDVAVLVNQNTSELGRFAVSDQWRDMGGFKTPTLRNVELTAPYMHDGSLKTLEEVVDHYNNGGKLEEKDPEASGFLSGGIRPLNLSDQQKKDLVAFMKTLTSPEVAQAAAAAAKPKKK
ncbi:MAG TPA: cytochrome c peroxidase [Nevskiaceae bacterium]|nr:cytochrome c peroxidase [Nevskiaceae bacterium]